MKAPQLHKEQASAIVVVLSVTVTVAMIVAVAMEYTASIRRNVQRSEVLQSATSVGDGVLEHAFAHWRETSRTKMTAEGALDLHSSDFATIPLPTQDQFPTITSFTATRSTADLTLAHAPTVSNFKVLAVDPEYNPIDDGSPIIKGIGQSPNSATWNYLAQADVTLPVVNNNITTRVRRIFQKERLSPWNWAIFYVDPLEIQPGAVMRVSGWVHTNSTLYTGHNELTFASKVTYAADWFIGFKPGDARAVGGSAPESPSPPLYERGRPPAYDVAHQPFGLDAGAIFSTDDTNPNNDSYRELIEQKSGTKTDPLAGERYYDQAAIRILIDGSNNVTIKKLNGSTVNGSSSGNDLKLYNAVTNALTKDQVLQDNREVAQVRLATLDVGSLVGSLNANSSSSSYIAPALWNGIIYVADTSAVTTTGSEVHRGIRLTNGAVIPANGLTVATPNPIYIQGDYNTGTGTVPSNATTNNDPATPQAAGYTRQPCAVVADAVTIMSNNWDDSHLTTGLSTRTASNTTINTAIVAGIVPSANNHYSGGAENFPRFLESWSNKIITYYGSMVELYQSKQSIGYWGKDNVYDAPIRHWYFDTNLQVNTPPGSLFVYSYTKGRWFVAQ